MPQKNNKTMLIIVGLTLTMLAGAVAIGRLQHQSPAATSGPNKLPPPHADRASAHGVAGPHGLPPNTPQPPAMEKVVEKPVVQHQRRADRRRRREGRQDRRRRKRYKTKRFAIALKRPVGMNMKAERVDRSAPKMLPALPALPTRTEVRQIMASARQGIRRCYDQGMVPGTVAVKLTLKGRSGSIAKAALTSSTVSPAMERCIKRALRDLHFPRFARNEATIHYPYRFQ